MLRIIACATFFCGTLLTFHASGKQQTNLLSQAHGLSPADLVPQKKKANLLQSPADINSIILEQIGSMPVGGKYSTKEFPIFASSIQSCPHEGLIVNTNVAKPSFCSSATYMVFLKTLLKLQKDSAIDVSSNTWNALLVRPQQVDGVGIWGRWNANGPGTGCLFRELSLGPNFTDFKKAKPGDFAKFFWTTEVGKLERGHSVIYLGSKNQNGVETVRFWSSNIPDGYGEKSIPRTRIKNAIFSRLIVPQNIEKPLPDKNNYLASLLKKRSSFREAVKQCGATF